MNLSRWIICLIMISSLSISAQINSKSYFREVRKERKTKDKEFRDPKESPLPADAIESFKGLKYFETDTSFVVSAVLHIESSPDTIKMKTTTERLPLYLVYGTATFQVDGKEHTLTIYRNVGLMSKPGFEDYLFVPFTDQTSGEESYGGGRYVDARIPQNNILIIDFNKAYNPYCTYNKKYSCPIPPSQNYIEAKITAGELKYH